MIQLLSFYQQMEVIYHQSDVDALTAAYKGPNDPNWDELSDWMNSKPKTPE